MLDLSLLLDTSAFPARWHCGMWTPIHGWTHIVSDIAVWAAYTAIPIVLFAFVRRRDDIPFPRVFWLFGAFILACGITHLVEATIFWKPWYRLSALLKATTAIVSWMTVGALIRVLPAALQLPGVMKRNEQLTAEIEQRKAAEELLRESERRLRSIVEQMPVLLDAFDEEGRVVFWNAECARVTGWEYEELMAAEDPLGLLYPDDEFRSEMMEEWERRGSSFRNWEIPMVCRDQSIRTISWSNLSGVAALPGWTSWAVGVDVTDRVAAEERLVATAADLARSNADLERFAASASHDLRAPLRGIRSLAEWVIEDDGEKLGEESANHMRLLVNRVERLDSMVAGLLSVAKAGVEFGEDAAPVMLDTLIRDLREDVALPNEFSFECEKFPAPLHGPAPLLQQVLRNLVQNAVNHHDRAEGRIVLSAQVDGRFARMTVADDGPGIPASASGRVFELFRTLAPRPDGELAGLGLATVRRIVERAGGEIRVIPTAEGERGATFEFTWPLAKPGRETLKRRSQRKRDEDV